MSNMNHLPTAWIIPDPGMQLIKRGRAYYSKPAPAKPAKEPPSGSKTEKARNTPT